MMNSLEDGINQIIKSIDSIEKYGYKDKLDATTLDELYSIRAKLLDDENSDKEDIISMYKNIATKVWKDYLMFTESKDGFRYLVHNIGDREYYDAYRDNVMSTSLITNRHIAFFSQWAPGIPNGFIINPESIKTATFFDNTIDNADSNSDGDYNWLQLPYELEHDSIDYDKQNNSYLNYKTKGSRDYFGDNYNEIACDDYNVVGYFYVSFGEGELNPVYKKSKRMAKAREIPLKEIDFMQVRAENGLEPMNDDMKKVLFRNLMLRHGNQLREKDPFKYYPVEDKDFINQNYENFAQKYMKLKQSPDFSTDNILKQFRQTLLDHEYNMSVEQPEYAIGSGLYIDEMSDEDWIYIDNLKAKSSKEANTKSNNLTWKQVAEGSIDAYKNNPNETLDLLRKLREELLGQDKFI